jgi:hypothetical protein
MKQSYRLLVAFFFSSTLFGMKPTMVPQAEQLLAAAQDTKTFFGDFKGGSFGTFDATKDYTLDGKKYNITKWPDWPPSQLSYLGVARREIKDDVENYKFYLMPSKENRIAIFDQMLAYMEKHPDNVEGVKMFMQSYDDEGGVKENLPVIVVYPTNRASAQEVLNDMYQMFQNEQGLNKYPRFSRKITDLIYYTQGSASIKEKAKPGESFEDVTLYPKGYYPKDAPQMPHYSHLHENLRERDIFKYHLAHPNSQEEQRLQKIRNNWYKENKLETMVKKPSLRQGYGQAAGWSGKLRRAGLDKKTGPR